MQRETDDVLTVMANCMVLPELPFKAGRSQGQLVVLLGAGCSRQYGLPSFLELLTYLGRYLRQSTELPLKLESLRDNLDKYWQPLGPAKQHEFLDFYLGRADGSTCPGYVHLARLARAGFVKAFINMNFDALLEDALEAEGVIPLMSTSFRTPPKARPKGKAKRDKKPAVAVYKPHGTIKRHPPDEKVNFILDLANSDLFDNPGEQEGAQELLAGHDVLVIGYSGIDAKIAATLRAYKTGIDPRDIKLFVVNTSRPDPRLLLVMADRASQHLLVTGADGGFENFMTNLDRKMSNWPPTADDEIARDTPREGVEGNEGPGGEEAPEEDGDSHFIATAEHSYMTEAENKALSNCLRLAMEIRFSLNVAERNLKSIEEHGKETFGRCLALATSAGVSLSSAEKYLLRCASILHDLGYYRGYSRDEASENPGWKLLCLHGRMTRKLLHEKFEDAPDFLLPSKPLCIIPVGHFIEARVFQDLLFDLCEFHSVIETGPRPPKPNIEVIVNGAKVPLRFSLLLSLFALAEDLAESHPFLPSADPVGPRSAESAVAILDPILDLYLRRKKEVIDYKIEQGIIRPIPLNDGRHPRRYDWLLGMAARHVADFDKAAQSSSGWGIKLHPPWSRPTLGQLEFALLGKEALEEKLGEALEEVQADAPGEATALLDLIAVYCKLGESEASSNEEGSEEPRLELEGPGATKVVNDILDRADEVAFSRPERLPAGSLLQYYYPARKKHPSERTEIESVFLKSFEVVLYPAWRFFARNWHDGIESTLMALACFDMGSSAFRPETLGGVRHLLGERRVKWEGRFAYGHHFGSRKCTLCTSRLLYIFSHARRLFSGLGQSEAELRKLGINSNENRTLDQTVEGIIRYMLTLDHAAIWGIESDKPGQVVHSADYCTWAVRAVAWCLAVDRELSEAKGFDWLGGACHLEREEVEELFTRLCAALFEADEEALSEGAEEPHSFIFGHIALACLELQRLQLRVVENFSESLGKRVEEMARKLQRFDRPSDLPHLDRFSQLDKFFFWPAYLLFDATGIAPDRAESAVQLCYDCVESLVWIGGGPEAGSWGFNVKNTQSVVGSLCGFWTYVLHRDRRRHFEDLFKSEGGKRAASSAPRQSLEEHARQESRAASAKAARPRRRSEA